MPSPSPAAELARLLAEQAEAVCQKYLFNGRRCGRHWVVGDVSNSPGRSTYVRLRGPTFGKGAAGRWCDAATGDHGDLLDLIRLNRGFDSFRDAFDEARSFLNKPRESTPRKAPPKHSRSKGDSSGHARKLFRAGRPIAGTLAETYLRSRGITCPLEPLWSLRFHPACFYRAGDDAPRETWPALLAAIIDANGTITAVQRTWLARDGSAKAPVDDPRRTLGPQLGGGVRLGLIGDVLTIGEGLETMLSIRTVLPSMPVLAGLSANHLARLELPSGLKRLYVARDNDPEGLRAHARLRARYEPHGVEIRPLQPAFDDFNADLRLLGPALRRRIVRQLVREDRQRFAAA